MITGVAIKPAKTIISTGEQAVIQEKRDRYYLGRAHAGIDRSDVACVILLPVLGMVLIGRVVL
jgi:hypothetical protein